VQSLHGGPSESANDKLCRLLFFIGALKDIGAARVVPAPDSGLSKSQVASRATVADVPFALVLRFNAPILINKKKQIIAEHGRARLRTTHKAKELLTRARVIADHAEQAAGSQRGSEHVHTT
jgi:hypothetical protein